MKRKKRNQIIWVIVMSAASLLMLVPIIMMFMTSFKTMEEIKSPVFHLFPQTFSLDNYKGAMSNGSWMVYFRNSLCITGATVLFSLLFNSIAGYAFARLKFRGSKIMFLFLMVGLMMPPQVTMLPTFLIMAGFPLAGGNDIFGAGGTGLVNTYAGLVIPLVSGSYGVFLCKQFYENFPRSLDEAAEIDGAGKWRTYFTVYLPNSKAILATLGLLKAVAVWNDYMWPLVMTNSEGMKTVQLALTMFKTDSGVQWNQMMAAAVLVALPMFVLFLCAQKYFIQGIVTSGLK
ncbi:carbohydrate ABC transporter permease [Enterocloster clostridioformis]|uniref:Carbohydrate ABC transporter membrane protein 2, CUT1 family n=1 Tax=Enterocloster clostridioformis TaxID=1531 RepID=A0A1I0JDS7_9FIRM|nr:carbohydrate ABC transporter permease [Enterocloster clostridioformis]SEU08247.1 carbohydrate ABC transporter membrane protein 2, CUT1 family [Enterocloster clostridioformis]SEW45302.1 carbohydrate ABC transporter membrane protein 2, CUT1 family [Enterocloster clostridioformis]